MDPEKKARLTAHGWQVGTVQEFLGLTRDETSSVELRLMLAAAPERVHDPECPYDPNDPAAVEAFWKDATVRRPGRVR